MQIGVKIERKEENGHDVHNVIRATHDGDDTARAGCLPGKFRDPAGKPYRRIQAAFEHELGRGHRRERQSMPAHALVRGKIMPEGANSNWCDPTHNHG